jgi:hypothetical protein
MPEPESRPGDAVKDYRDRCEELTGTSLWACPVCHHGRMLEIEILARAAASPPVMDTS